MENSSSSNKDYSELCFDDIFMLYDFNRKMRSLIFSAIGDFEIHLKTSIAYNFCAENNSWNSYMDVNNYRKVDEIHDRYKTFVSVHGYNPKSKSQNINKKLMLPIFNESTLITKAKNKRYINSYSNHPPFWVSIKILDFGQTHTVFTILKRNVAEKVLRDFNLTLSDRNLFDSVLHIINWLRNECGHFEMINNSRYHSRFKIEKTLINNLNLIVNRSRQNLTLFQCLYILNNFRPVENDINKLITNSPVNKDILSRYFKFIGYKKINFPNIHIDI